MRTVLRRPEDPRDRSGCLYFLAVLAVVPVPGPVPVAGPAAEPELVPELVPGPEPEPGLELELVPELEPEPAAELAFAAADLTGDFAGLEHWLATEQAVVA